MYNKKRPVDRPTLRTVFTSEENLIIEERLMRLGYYEEASRIILGEAEWWGRTLDNLGLPEFAERARAELPDLGSGFLDIMNGVTDPKG